LEGEVIDMLPETSSQSRAKVKWTVTMDTDEGTVDGVIININKNGAFIRCQRPLRLSETFKLSIDSPDHPIQDITAEVVWTNIHGPDDELTPRGMGVRFEEITEKERKFLRKLVSGNGKSEDVPVVELSETMH